VTDRSGAPASRGRSATPTPNGDDARVVPVFDGHNDLLTALHWPRRSGPRDVFTENASGHLDLPRMRAGAMAGGFFSLFVPSQEAPNDFAAHADARGHYRLPLPEPLEPDRALRDVVAMLAELRRIEVAADGALRIVRDPASARAAMAAGTVAAALHLEGADAIDPDLDALWLLHAAGLRALGPAWSRPNRFAHGVPLAFPADPDQGPGLTEAGRALVRGCDELGILIDVSHLTAAGFWDVLAEAQGVVVATHSNAHALCPHSRNLTDRQLDALAERGGVVGLNFAAGFLAPDGSWDASLPLEVLVRHLDHLVARLGPNGVALGSDFDGARIPTAIGDAAGLPALFAALRRAGWDEAALTLLASENWLRVWGALAA
jgi:membrane dipeptidase